MKVSWGTGLRVESQKKKRNYSWEVGHFITASSMFRRDVAGYRRGCHLRKRNRKSDIYPSGREGLKEELRSTGGRLTKESVKKGDSGWCTIVWGWYSKTTKNKIETKVGSRRRIVGEGA